MSWSGHTASTPDTPTCRYRSKLLPITFVGPGHNSSYEVGALHYITLHYVTLHYMSRRREMRSHNIALHVTLKVAVRKPEVQVSL